MVASNPVLRLSLLPAWSTLWQGTAKKNEKDKLDKAGCVATLWGRAFSKEDVVWRVEAKSIKHTEETGRTREGTRSATSCCPCES